MSDKNTSYYMNIKSLRETNKNAKSNPNAKRIEMSTAGWLLRHYGDTLPADKKRELKKLLGMPNNEKQEGGKRHTKRRHTKRKTHKRRHTRRN